VPPKEIKMIKLNLYPFKLEIEYKNFRYEGRLWNIASVAMVIGLIWSAL